MIRCRGLFLRSVLSISNQSVISALPGRGAAPVAAATTFFLTNRFAGSTHARVHTRRRRRGGVGAVEQTADENSQDQSWSSGVNKHVGVKDPLMFAVRAQEFLDKIEESLQPMKSCNDIFEIRRESNSLVLTLAPGDGQYSFEIEESSCSVVFQSALSGKFQYILSASTGEWVSGEDGHLVEGMFVRDLIRQCNGLPDL